MRRPPAWLAGLLLAALAASGWSLGQVAGSPPVSSSTLTHTDTSTSTSTRTVKRVTRGKVVTLPGGTQVVKVPVLIVRTDHHTIRVPAHLVPLTRVHTGGGASSTVATPTVPVTVTVYLPAEPVTVTSVTTTTEVILSTITLPALTDGSTPEQEVTK